ncbi:hypothetical protein KIL84_005027 [Mauremys mutica]|uniref:Uncharacterized protein n=1 Tax=Mauremys mutica TaxID=74926 RepID=A0A9D3XK65_9SAUR|nr:hypothetical protein KIL84_005027 [Mauremys mutica]
MLETDRCPSTPCLRSSKGSFSSCVHRINVEDDSQREVGSHLECAIIDYVLDQILGKCISGLCYDNKNLTSVNFTEEIVVESMDEVVVARKALESSAANVCQKINPVAIAGDFTYLGSVVNNMGGIERTRSPPCKTSVSNWAPLQEGLLQTKRPDK